MEDVYRSADEAAGFRRISSADPFLAEFGAGRLKQRSASIASENRSICASHASAVTEATGRLTMEQLRHVSDERAASWLAHSTAEDDGHEAQDLVSALRAELKWNPTMAGMLTWVKIEQRRFEAECAKGDVAETDVEAPIWGGDLRRKTRVRGKSQVAAAPLEDQDEAEETLKGVVGTSAAETALADARRMSNTSLGSEIRRSSTAMIPEVEDALSSLNSSFQFRSKRISSTTLKRIKSLTTRTLDLKFRTDLYQTAALAAPRQFILMPGSHAKLAWDLLIAFCVCYSVVTVPLLISFLDESTVGVGMTSVNALVDGIFILDILCTFRTSYEDSLHGIVITSPKHIAWRYVTSFFVVDFLAALPLDLILLASESFQTVEFKSVARFNKLLRLLRIFKLMRVLSFAATHGFASSNPSLITLLKLLFSLVLMWHWVACGHYYFAITASTDDPTYTPGAGNWFPPEHLAAPTVSMRYLYSLNWAVAITCQIASPEPENLSQQLFGVSVMMISVAVTALVIGSATTLLSDLQKERSEVTLKLQAIDRCLKHKRVPAALRQRITSFYRFQYESLRVDEAGVLAGLPRSLKLQMDLIVHHGVFTRLSLFRGCSREELLMLVQKLTPSMAMPGETLIQQVGGRARAHTMPTLPTQSSTRPCLLFPYSPPSRDTWQGAVGLGMFFLMQGAVEVLQSTTDDSDVSQGATESKELINVMLAVCAFGERALSHETATLPAHATVRALRFCELSVLLREDFFSICKLNPGLRVSLREYVLGRDDASDKAVERSSTRSSMRNSVFAIAGMGSSPQQPQPVDENRLRELKRAKTQANLHRTRTATAFTGRGWVRKSDKRREGLARASMWDPRASHSNESTSEAT